MHPNPSHPRASSHITALVLAGLVLLYWVVRLWLISSPSLSQVDYDEAVTGLMALDIMRGNHHLLFWGQPYMGTMEAYLAAGLFQLFGPSTFLLRLVLLIYGSLGVLALFGLGRAVGGWWTGVLAGALWSLPPLFMSFQGVYVTGGHLEAVVAGAVVLWGVMRLASGRARRPALFSLGLGLAAGLGLWSSLMALPLLAAAGLGLVLARPAWLLGAGPWCLGAGALAGASPLILWNLEHDWLTMVQLGGSHLERLGSNAAMLMQNVWTRALTGAWWDGRSVAGDMPSALPWVVLLLVYLPAAVLALATAANWARRAWRRQWPWQGPVDIIALTLLALLFIHASSGYGHKAIMRYAAPLMVPVTVLAALWLRRLWAWRAPAGAVLLTGLMAFNLYTHLLYMDRHQDQPRRPVEAAMDKLDGEGVSFAYAHGRVALPLTFESEGRILAADFFGARNSSHLKRVDRSARPALVTHQRLAVPPPGIMEQSLKRLGAWKEPLQVDDYVMWHDFPPAPVLAPVPSTSWRPAGFGEGAAPVADRDLATVWKASPKHDSMLFLDLGQPRELARLSLLPGPEWKGRPGMHYEVLVEGSTDGLTWRKIAGGKACMAGLSWRGRRVKLEPVPALQFNFAPTRARWLRITCKPSQRNWPPLEVAEAFVYRPAEQPQAWPGEAMEQLARGRQALAAWHQRPTAPFPGGHSAFARFWASQVDWPVLMGHLRAAAEAAPQWEEPLRLQLEAVRKGREKAAALLKHPGRPSPKGSST
ncbi:MAG: discoidin domain-containing protein [Desulfarculaceae bacterium]|nr:discoidin domain-containing protein [Desulfarculaceae bacterium]